MPRRKVRKQSMSTFSAIDEHLLDYLSLVYRAAVDGEHV